MYEPLHHKYRPQIFSQLVGQGAIATTLTHALEQNRIAPAYLFCGPRGTGKTSSARILAKSLNCLDTAAPTPKPCGSCDVCTSVNKGSSLDIVEIDAASNTGVDNIRELIERSQFAPVQCRYKVYVIDECLTGDTQITTDTGFLRIDDPQIIGRKVLSYDENTQSWKFKPVVKRFEQGKRQTYTISTSQFKIKCTDNHLIRTEQGWVAAKNVKEGTKILSPVSVDAAPTSLNSAQMVAYADLPEDTSLRGTRSGKKNTVLKQSWMPLSPSDLAVPVDVVNDWKFRSTCKKKATVSQAFALTGKGILSRKSMVSGSKELRTLWTNAAISPQLALDSSTELCLETALSAIPMRTADFLDWLGLMGSHSRNGLNIKQADCQNWIQRRELLPTMDMEKAPRAVTQFAILSWLKSLTPLSQRVKRKASLLTGWIESRLKALLGGTWTMARFNLLSEAVQLFSSTQKDFACQTIFSSLTSYRRRDTAQKRLLIPELKQAQHIHISPWALRSLENSSQISNPSLSPQWNTSLETVKSVEIGEVEPVYDIEVEDNHNFVANGLLVHNCHMLSAAAFNALLKTLEEPPDRVVFVLATTDPQRVLPTIISRCQRFDFRRIPLPAMVKHLQYIATEESIAIAPSATQLVAQISQGGLRDAESLLDQLSLQPDEITVESVWELVGAVPERDLLNLVRAIAANDGPALIDRVRQLMDKGREPLIVLQSLVGFYRDLLIAKRAPSREDLVAITPPTWLEMTDFAQQLSAAQLLASQQKLQSAEVQVKNTTQPRLWLEVTLTGLLPSALSAMADLASDSSRAISPQRSVALPSAVAPPISPPQSDAVSAADRAPVETPPEQPPETLPETPSEQPTETPPVEVAFSNLADLWNKLLAVLVPRGTQMLMAQQGVLLSFDGVAAKVGFRSASLQKLAQSRVPNIEAAFESLFQRKIKVTLNVITAEESPAREVLDPPPAPPDPPVRHSPSQQKPSPSLPSDVPSPSYTQEPSEQYSSEQGPPQKVSEPTENPPGSNGSQGENTHKNGSSANGGDANGTRSRLDAPAANIDFDQDQEKIKRFANFFNGQIVNLSDDANDDTEKSTDNQQRPGSSRPGSSESKSSDPGPDVPF